jgi:hypothetical protein
MDALSSTTSLRYESFCNWIGGENDPAGVLIGGQSASPFFFAGSLFALEALWLKLQLFHALSESVASLYQQQKRPLLNISPDQAQVTPASSGFFPASKFFSVKLSEAVIAPCFAEDKMPESFRSRFFLPTPSPYSDCLKFSPLGTEKKVTVIIRRLDRLMDNADGLQSGIIQFQVVSPEIDPKQFSTKDIFRLVLPLHEASSIFAWANPIAFEERALVLSGTTDPMSPAVWKWLEENQTRVHPQSLVQIYVVPSISSDFFSLGMMLFRTLLVNDKLEMGWVHAAIQRVVKGLKPMVQGMQWDQKEDAVMLSKRIRWRLKEEGEIFLPGSGLYRQSDRASLNAAMSDSPPYPQNLWYDTLILGFRLVAPIPGLGFCEDKNDVEQPNLLFGHLMADISKLIVRVRIELFGSRERNREILMACDQVRESLLEH